VSDHDDTSYENRDSVRWNGHVPGDLAHAAVADLLAAYTAGELDAAERAAVARHLDGCDRCRAALAETQHIRALLATLAAPAAARVDTLAPAPALADTVLARLAPRDKPLIAIAAPPDPFEASTPAEPAPGMHARGDGMRRSPYLAAASVLLVIALGVTLFGFLGPRLRTGADSAIPYTVAAQRAFDRQGGIQLDLTVGCLSGEPPCNIDVAMPTLQTMLTTRLNTLGIPYALARQTGPATFQALLPGVTDASGIAPALIAPGRLSLLDTGTFNFQLPPPVRLPPLPEPSLGCLKGCLFGGVAPARWPGTTILDWFSPPDPQSVRAEVDPGTHQPVVSFAYTGAAQRVLAQYARAHEGSYLAVILDLDVLQAPILSVMITADLNGAFTVSGFATLADARALAAVIRSGPLPRTLHVTGERYVAPQAPTTTATPAATASPTPAATPAGTPAPLASFGPDAILGSLTMLSSTEGWAAGSTMGPDSSGGLRRVPLLLHYAGGRLAERRQPN
jgi:SecD-like export protein/putative zinc finger protein